MKNIVYIKRLNVEALECECCPPKDLIMVSDVNLLVRSQHGLVLIEGKEYKLFLDITCDTPDREGYGQSFIEHEPILDELNEYYEFLMEGRISKDDFDILLDGKVGVFEYRKAGFFEFREDKISEDYYKIIGQVQGEYLIANGVYFYIGKNRESQNSKFLVAYIELPYLCEKIETI